MEHTEGEYTLQEIKSTVCGFDGVGYICILAPDGERVATVDILDQTDIDHAHKIRDLLNAFNGISTHDALNIIQVAKSLQETPGNLKYLEYGPEVLCVNACAGMSDLEVKHIPEMIETLGTEWEKFGKSQSDYYALKADLDKCTIKLGERIMENAYIEADLAEAVALLEEAHPALLGKHIEGLPSRVRAFLTRQKGG